MGQITYFGYRMNFEGLKATVTVTVLLISRHYLPQNEKKICVETRKYLSDHI